MSAPQRSLDSAPGPEVEIGGRRFLYFGGTGYLGIQGRPELADAADAAMRRYGLHPATSRLGYGNPPPLLEAEAEAAAFFGTEAAWLLPSGWTGASILLDAHRGRNDRIFVDRDAHFALRDAARLSGRPTVEFDHRDADALRARIDPRPVVLTDGVFPVSGQLAPLRAYLEVLGGHDRALLLVDDAHGFGVLGEAGRGSVELAGAEADARVLWTGTASKALGGYGGLLPGSAERIEGLRAASRWFEGSTPPPVPVAAATAAALRIARTEPGLRRRLAARVAALRAGMRGLGLAVEDLPTPIVPLVPGPAAAMRKLAEALREDGVLVPYLPRYAGLGADGALRLAVFATHEPEHIERLCDALRRHL
jgi:glycine C-acetyltransferase/8-amino-7-oxononanoate synthase